VRHRLAVVLAALALAATACGSDGPSAEEKAERTHAVDVLVASGLSKDQASCMVDRLGADTVVEAANADVLADGEPYQQAAKACLQ